MRPLVIAMLAAALCCVSAGAMAGDDGSTAAAVTTPSRPIAGSRNCRTYYPHLDHPLDDEGDVIVGYDVEADGRISNVRLVVAGGFERLDQAALGCVGTEWRNTPALANGVPVASRDHRALFHFSQRRLSTPEDFLAWGTEMEAKGSHAAVVAILGYAIALKPSAEAFRARARAQDALGHGDLAKADNTSADALANPH